MITRDFLTTEVTLGESGYPKLLSKISDPPKKLYIKGEYSAAMLGTCLAIVGSRKITSYGQAVLEHLFRELATSGVTIVSGFTRGVDALSHRLSIHRGIPTVAVMPCGIDTIYPSFNKELYFDILKNKGLIISEYPGSEYPRDWTFIRRNRIIAGLSKAVVVVEAAKNSGSLTTAVFAKKFKRKLLAVPGNIFSENEAGICQIISDGAKPVFSGRDINMILKLKNPSVAEKTEVYSQIERDLVNSLKTQPKNIDALARDLSSDVTKISIEVAKLQIAGVIKEINGVLYVI